MSNIVEFNLHPRQTEAFLSSATEILYGGAAGGGKSHLMRACAVTWCMQIAKLQVYIFRRKSPDLKKNHLDGPSGLRSMLDPLIKSGYCNYNKTEKIFEFWNGSQIYLCHCQYEDDMYNYQGAEIHVLMIDELTHFTEAIYNFLRGRLRMAGVSVPEQYAGMFPRILCGSNPGNIGHNWVKSAFVDYAPPMEINRTGREDGGLLRQYIPAKLADNPTILEEDPGYEARLEGLGSESLVRAMKDGDWDIVDGAYFSEFKKEIHVMKPFTIPHEWARVLSHDWGSAKPFCFLWGAISDGTYKLPNGRYIPKNAIIIYREWYGSNGEPNVGLKMVNNEIAKQAKKLCRDEKYSRMVADPAIFSTAGGPSIAETYQKEGVKFYRADNKRVAGWQQVRMRLVGTDESEGEPLLYFFENCKDIIRTLPALMHDSHSPEDVDSEMEDHAPDTLRYLCMARPMANTPRSNKKKLPDHLAVNPPKRSNATWDSWG